MRGYSSAWMFYTWPPKTLGGDMQALNLAFLRLLVIGFYKPIALPINRALGRWLAGPN